VPSESSSQVTLLPSPRCSEVREALDALMPLVYEELRRLACQYLQRKRPNHTLQSTALAHEAYVRLLGQDPPEWKGRTHFFGVAARLMRQILVDHARGHLPAKRSENSLKLTLNEGTGSKGRDFDDALNQSEQA